MRLKDKLHSLQFLTRHKLFRTLLVLILRRDEARTPLSHLSWPPYPFCLLNTLYYKTYIYIFCKKPNHWELVSCWCGSNRASFNWLQSLYDYLKILKELDWTACKNQTIFFPHLIWLCPPATFASIHRLPGHTCTLIWATKGGGRDKQHMEMGRWLHATPARWWRGLSDRVPQAPPWWLISSRSPELRSDTPAHQTPFSLPGTPLIAQRYIIVDPVWL